jgi:hypothetical protein
MLEVSKNDSISSDVFEPEEPSLHMSFQVVRLKDFPGLHSPNLNSPSSGLFGNQHSFVKMQLAEHFVFADIEMTHCWAAELQGLLADLPSAIGPSPSPSPQSRVTNSLTSANDRPQTLWTRACYKRRLLCSTSEKTWTSLRENCE